MEKTIKLDERVIIDAYCDVKTNKMIIMYNKGKKMVKDMNEHTISDLSADLTRQVTHRHNLVIKYEKQNSRIIKLTLIGGLIIVIAGFATNIMSVSLLSYASMLGGLALAISKIRRNNYIMSKIANADMAEIVGHYYPSNAFDYQMSLDKEIETHPKNDEIVDEKVKHMASVLPLPERLNPETTSSKVDLTEGVGEKNGKILALTRKKNKNKRL